MQVTLSPDLEAIVQGYVAGGDFPDASAVVAEALRLLDEHNRMKLERLRAAIQLGMDDFENGRYRAYTPEVHAEILANARRKIREGHTPDLEVCP